MPNLTTTVNWEFNEPNSNFRFGDSLYLYEFVDGSFVYNTDASNVRDGRFTINSSQQFLSFFHDNDPLISQISFEIGQPFQLTINVDWDQIDWGSNSYYDVYIETQYVITVAEGAQHSFGEYLQIKLWKDARSLQINYLDMYMFPKMLENDKEMISYYSARQNEVIRLKAIDSFILRYNYNDWVTSGSTLNWNSSTQNVSFLRDWNDESMSAYTLEQNIPYWHDNTLVHVDGMSCSARDANGNISISPWDSAWIKFTSTGLAEVIISSPLTANKNIRMVFSVSNGPVIVPNWVAENSLTSENPSFLQFRHDLRNAIYEAIDQKVRDTILDEVSRYTRFSDGDPLENFNIYVANNTELLNRIDNYIKQLEYGVEGAMNALGEEEIQSVYTSLYARLKEWEANLGQLITETLQKTVENYQRSEELVNLLEQRAKSETLIQYSTTISQYPIEKIEFWLNSQYGEQYWDISRYATIKNDQLMIELPKISEITGIQTIDKFVPWYIYIWPKREIILQYEVLENRRIIFETDKDLTDVLWSTIYDTNNQSYKIVNYEDVENQRVWILDKNIDSNAIGNPLTIYYNYFDPQAIKVDISWLHNYIPKEIPIGSLYQPSSEEIPEEIEETQVETEVISRSAQKEYNKEIF